VKLAWRPVAIRSQVAGACRRMLATRSRRKRLAVGFQSLEPRRALDVSAAGLASEAVVARADTVAPEVRSVKAPASQTYAAGRTLSFTVKFTEPVVATGAPTLPIGIGDTVRQAVWNGAVSDTKSLTFTTVVQPGDLAPTGVRIAGPIEISDGAAIRDRAGNGLVPAAAGTFPKARVDAVGPRVSGFGTVSVTPKLVALRVTFDEPVRVTGKPSIPFTLAGVPKQLVYASGSGGSVLTFRYKAAKAETPTAETVAIPTPAIALGSGRITDTARNAAISLTSPDAPTPDTSMHFVTVGDAGNAADDTGLGAVDYVYRIGAFEVTIGQYAEFLNAVARADTHDLYNPGMASDLNSAGISRSGSAGAYTYTVMHNGGDSFDRPITYVTWFDAARFANWMHNGRPTGPQNAATTEDGAYTLDGATSGPAPVRNTGATFSIPTENEWYKAAYYKGGGLNAGYWDYATQSDSVPGNTVGGGTNQANFYSDVDRVFSVTRSSSYRTNQNYLTSVGAFTASGSSYGTFDQSGNVWEWNDLTGGADASRGLRGGSWGNVALDLSSSFGDVLSPSIELRVGFRLVSRA